MKCQAVAGTEQSGWVGFQFDSEPALPVVSLIQHQPLPLRFVSSTTRGDSPQRARKHEVPHARGVPRLICFDSCETAIQRSYPLLVLSTHGPCDQHGGSFGVMGVICLLCVVCVVHSRCVGFLFHTLSASQFERFAGKALHMASRLTVKQTQPKLHATGPAHGHKTSAIRREKVCRRQSAGEGPHAK